MPQLKFRVAATATALLVVGVGVTACGGSAKTSSSSTTTTVAPTKAAFCVDNVTLDKASAHTSPADFLTALKANTAALDRMANNVPNDPAIRADAQTLIAAGRTALATNNPSVLQEPSLMAAGAKVDAYCGVDGTGDPLPSYFGAGKDYQACKNFIALDKGVRSAANPQAAVAFLKAHEGKVNDLEAEGLHRVGGIRQVQTLVTAVRKAIATNDGRLLYTPAVIKAATQGNSYCGVHT